jgi:beta-galactosidase
MDGATRGRDGAREGRASGKLAVGETRFLPISVPLNVKGAGKKEAKITLEATVGGKKLGDAFAFRVYGAPSPLPAAERTVTVYDPAGKTTALLTALGYKVSPWRGAGSSTGLVVIGREAFGKAGGVKPGTFEPFVRGGGRLLILSQTPEYLKKEWGLRVAAHAARRVWPVPSATSKRWFEGVDGEDLRDWNGASSLLTPYPDYTTGDMKDERIVTTGIPYYAFRWGTRGASPACPSRSRTTAVGDPCSSASSTSPTRPC